MMDFKVGEAFKIDGPPLRVAEMPDWMLWSRDDVLPPGSPIEQGRAQLERMIILPSPSSAKH